MLIRHKDTGAVLAEVPGASITGVDISGRDLRGADLSAQVIAATCLRGANLSGADLTGTAFLGCDLTEADISDADGEDVQFVNTVLSRASFRDARARRLCVRHEGSPFLADFKSAGDSIIALGVAWGAVWSASWKVWSAVAVVALVIKAAFSLRDSAQWRRLPGWWNPRLWQRLYRKPEMLHADMHGACLCDAKLTGLEMPRSDLSDADLSGADLQGANLVRANLAGADLHGTDLSYAMLIDTNIVSAHYDATTRWPADFRRVHHEITAVTH
jgi:uncharacterized protein YjbI with pentapeptide repeats